jgi:tyrosine recombinase XerC
MDTTLKETIGSYCDYMEQVRHLSEHTVKAYRHDLRLYEQFIVTRDIPMDRIQFEDARRFVSRLHKHGYSQKSINRIISAIKSFYSYCITYDIVETSPFSEVKSMKPQKQLPTVLTKDEVELIINAPDDDTLGIRDRTMFSLLYSTGCRLSEMLQIDIDHIELEVGRILVHGKGRRDRFVFLTREAGRLLELYLPLRYELLKSTGISNTNCRALFINKRGKRLTPQGVHYIFHTYVRMLGIDKHVTPHTFRHTFATHILDNDAGIRVVQELLGHQNVSTTQIYSHVSTKRLKDVYKKSHPHGRRLP